MKKLIMAAFATLLIIGSVSSANARATKSTINEVRIHAARSETFSARRYHYSKRHHSRVAGYARRGGACDGFQRCRCGTTAARYHGLPYAYKGFNLKMASEWGRAFPPTSFGIGAVGVKPHHVLTVVGGSDCRSATVHDDAGTYQRNVCGMMFVAVGGGGFTQEASTQTHRHHHRRYASR